MFFTTQELPAGAAYKLLAGSIVPRPIALVTSVSGDGVVNAAPYSFFNVLGSDPPLLALGVGNKAPDLPKDTAHNIVQSGEFVVNLVSVEMAESMNICAVDFPAEFSEVEAAQYELGNGQAIKTPHIVGSPSSFECKLEQILQIGNNRVILGTVVGFHMEETIINLSNFRVNTDKMGLIGRMGGAGGYVRTTDTFEMARMDFSEWKMNQQNQLDITTLGKE
jgi:flavin reductase (DIM6/NTAB) family NADH-FMN oxidoreductase RutF